ncbi:ArsR/SmtB family transcription factor [Streptomyces sp. NRRL S-920]|uniref:ArsR/SmtB family transcription factor n=1 Tax=Streptomyces sp. NRRL S-920 TaxID=1463921 RepID=UPI0004C5CADE|nr:winged helix-turn-helix domain-containing protein [Streptomyces sp. NRRL S-920]
MTLRFHLTGEDLTRLRVAPEHHPLWEVLLSAHLLGRTEGSPDFDGWRESTRAKLVPEVRPLLALTPPRGYSPDFLTPTGIPGDIDAAIETVLSTPRQRLREDIDQLAVGRAPAAWAGAVRDGDPAALRRLGTALRTYHRSAVAPYSNRIEDSLRAEHARLAGEFLAGGIERVLAALAPVAQWEPPVLTLPTHPADRDIHLDGRGLILLPSFFCRRAPTTLRNPDGPHVLVYPVQQNRTWPASGRTAGRRGLAALLGQGRAEVLEAIRAGHATTTAVSGRTGLSLATVSHHTAVLREAGLITTSRTGSSVRHEITSIGDQLVCGRQGR